MIDRCFSSPEAVRGRKEEELTPLHERHNLIKRGKITPHEVRTKNHKAYKGIKMQAWIITCLIMCCFLCKVATAAFETDTNERICCFESSLNRTRRVALTIHDVILLSKHFKITMTIRLNQSNESIIAYKKDNNCFRFN